jgi:hypothetical protein
MCAGSVTIMGRRVNGKPIEKQPYHIPCVLEFNNMNEEVPMATL